jgi:hypothetical protein
MLLLVLSLGVARVAAHMRPTSMAALTVLPGDKYQADGFKVTAQLSTGHTASCTFRYRTLTPEEALAAAKQAAPTPPPAAVAPPPPSAGGPIDFGELVRRLTGQCVTRKIDYWDYEVCIGKAVTQAHGGEVYVLGRTPTVAEASIKYNDGQTCDSMRHAAARSHSTRLVRRDAFPLCGCAALNPAAPRSVELVFGCDRNAVGAGGSAGLSLLRVTEVRTCHYALSLATSGLCPAPGQRQDARWEDWTGQSAVSSQRPGGSDDSIALNPTEAAAEDWFVELTELNDGRAMCSAFSLEPRASNSKLHFAA